MFITHRFTHQLTHLAVGMVSCPRMHFSGQPAVIATMAVWLHTASTVDDRSYFKLLLCHKQPPQLHVFNLEHFLCNSKGDMCLHLELNQQPFACQVNVWTPNVTKIFFFWLLPLGFTTEDHPTLSHPIPWILFCYSTSALTTSVYNAVKIIMW